MAFIMAVVFLPLGQAGAAMVPGTTCDQAIMDVMDQRATLEARRENEVAQALILKPDSVLQYSCFRERAAALGADEDLILKPTNRYLQSNFNYAGASGRYTHSGDPCAFMRGVWIFSKCSNLDSSLMNTLDAFINGDPRAFPAECNAPNRSNIWQAAYNAANPPSTDLMEPATNYMPGILNMMDPLKCEEHKPIDTGMIVFDFVKFQIQSGGGSKRGFQKIERPDRFCPAPGCYYQFDESDLNGPGECKASPHI